jgi:tetratricopeptide (TPR) repeat protein
VSELDAAMAEDLEPTDRINLLQNRFTFHAARGEPIDEMMTAIRDVVAESNDPDADANMIISEAEAAFFAGRLAEAYASWRVIAERFPFTAAAMWAFACRAALWARDAVRTRESLEALDATGVHGAAIETTRLTFRAGLAALDGRTAEALGMYREALRVWRDLGVAFEEALAAMDMALLLDPAEPEVAAAAAAARETLVGLGARPLVERLDAALSTATVGASAAGKAAVDSPVVESAEPARSPA